MCDCAECAEKKSREFSMPKWGTIWAFITDGVEGVAVLAATQFNKQVLSKVKNPEDLKPYVLDLQAIITCIRAILNNHSAKFSEGKRKATEQLLSTLEDLLKALEDFHLTEEEFTQLLDNVKKTIQAFKDA